MRERVMKNSKKGFSLPLAIGISAFLIIISASLLFIAVQSTSTTSVQISGRQAYLNVRSAIEYAQAYYNTNVTDYSEIGTEYLIMEDMISGTTEDGAKISKDEEEAKKAITYVMSEYVKASGSNDTVFRLTAYSRYSDSFGNKAAVARLSVSFSVGGKQPNRITIASLPIKQGKLISQDKINLHIKKPASMEGFDLTYYIWTYKDTGKAYSGYNWNKDSGLTYDESGIISKLNTTTKDNPNRREPNAEWMDHDDDTRQLQKGPNGIVSNDGFNWFGGEYFINKNRVPWFNIIFAQRGSVLAGKNGPTNIYNSQTNEMFHLWYLDPSDKNIYFEFLGTKKQEKGEGFPNEKSVGHSYFTKYYEGPNWDGKQGLEDTILVYVNNPKTLVHFAIEGIDNDKTFTTIVDNNKKPIIYSVSNVDTSAKSYIHSGNKEASKIAMSYEGCGWWVANVETDKAFDITFNAYGAEGIEAKNVYPTDTSSDAKREFWFVYHPKTGKVDVCEDETIACGKRGILLDSYVTVHAKVANYDSGNASPRLTFRDVELNSSIGRTELIDVLIFYDSLDADNYETNSYKDFKKAYDDGWTMIKNTRFIEDIFIVNGVNTKPSATPAEKLAEANEKYQAQKTAIEEAYKALKLNAASKKQIATLTALVRSAQKIETAYNDNSKLPIYDYNYYDEFTKAESNFKKAESKIAENNLTSIDARDLIGYTDSSKVRHPGLSDDIDVMNRVREKDKDGNVALRGGKLNRDSLKNRIAKYEKYTTSTDYKKMAVAAFKSAWDAAVEARDKRKTTQDELDAALKALADAYTELSKPENSINDELNKTEVSKWMTEGRKYLDDKDAHYTQASYRALQTAYNNALENVSKVKTQAKMDELADALRVAVLGFEYPLPDGSLRSISNRGMFRVWVYGDQAPVGTTFMLYATGKEEGNFETDNYQTMSSWGDKDPTDAPELKDKIGYYYKDFDTNVFDKVRVEAEYNGKTYSSQEVKLSDITDGNLVFVINDKTVTTGKFASLYAMVKDEQTVKLKYGKNGMARSFLNTPYYEAKIVLTDKNKGSKFSLVCTTYDSVSGKDVVRSFVSTVAINNPGDYVVKVVKDGSKSTVYTVTPADILPADDAVNTEPETGGILAAGGIDIMDVAYTTANYVFFTDVNGDFAGDDKYGNKVWAYFYEGCENQSWPGVAMAYYRSYVEPSNNKTYHVYRARIPDGAGLVIFNNGGSGKQSKEQVVVGGQGYLRNSGYDEKDGRQEFTCSTWAETGDVKDYNYPVQDGYLYFKNTKNWTNVYAYFWGDSDKEFPKWPGYVVVDTDVKNGKTYYCIKPPVGAKSVVFNSGDYNDKCSDVSNFKLGYGYYPNSSSSPYKVNSLNVDGGEDDDTGVEDDKPDDDVVHHDGWNEDDLKADEDKKENADIPLAYVGGAKVRIRNASYAGTGKTNSNGNGIWYNSDSDKNQFGGDNSMNAGSGGRLGAASLSPYYDWYEVKLPISNKAKYTFALIGMSNKSEDKNVQTKTVAGASGNIWLEQLSNDRNGKSHFADINLYTFDPEEKENGTLPDTLTVYFKCPSKTVGEGVNQKEVSWSNPRILCSGPFNNDPEPEAATKKLSRYENRNIYCFEGISKNTPFIEFTVEDYDGKSKRYQVNLQGGDYVLFDPELDKGLGRWVTFVSDQDKLRRAVEDLRNMYYGYAIFDNQDSDGNIANKAERLYSQGLVSLVSNYSRKISTGGCDFYVMKIDEILAKDEATAWREYNGDPSASVGSDAYYGLNKVITNYKNLYSAIFDERAYISVPLTSADMKTANGGNDYYYPKAGADGAFIAHSGASGFYSEYVTRTLQTRRYDSDTIATLRQRLASAELVFLKGGTYSQVENAIRALKRAHDSLKLTSEGSVCCIFYDLERHAQSGYSYKLLYKESETGEEKSSDFIDDLNPDKYPILFLSTETGLSEGVETIYDVKFAEFGPGNISDTPDKIYEKKTSMDMDETWVFFPDENKERWEENCVYDYRQIDTDIFIQEDESDKRVFSMKSESTRVDDVEIVEYKTMVLNFAKDSQVNIIDSTKPGGYDTYNIKAGAYYFYDDDTKTVDDIGNPIETPIPDGQINLFSVAAKNYFTSPATYGKFVLNSTDASGNTVNPVSEAADLSWYTDGKFKTGGVQKDGYVNLEADAGNFATANDYQYFASRGLYFRWSGEKELVIAKEVSLASDEVRFASNAQIDGSRYMDSAHFYLCSGSENETMIVQFLSDVFVKYKNDEGQIIEFSIREGKYLLEKDPDRKEESAYVDYIADLFDIDYWKKMEYVTCLDRKSSSSSGTDKGKLHDGVYSD